ncbi:DUF6356 family protein [Planctomicrobium piriforme]|uniref:Uncharacterized protein n=1 Tax=Planctomicrobium piriforme TaxID=1576369 RepID=A0A1I3JVW5_9PLAN|nr:DUF6356 family protein [Planctomicrobium piriforme]SFI64324.1 hypothetical protein SAMN05421753_11129 [Planctomicrobium piriforme]
MNHLAEVNMTYAQHWSMATKNSGKLSIASCVLFVHACLPFLFERTASRILRSVEHSLPKAGTRILVRFNTKHREDPEGRSWRVLENGVETLAHVVSIAIPCETIREEVAGEVKYHFLCNGKVVWDGQNAKVVAS